MHRTTSICGMPIVCTFAGMLVLRHQPHDLYCWENSGGPGYSNGCCHCCTTRLLYLLVYFQHVCLHVGAWAPTPHCHVHHLHVCWYGGVTTPTTRHLYLLVLCFNMQHAFCAHGGHALGGNARDRRSVSVLNGGQGMRFCQIWVLAAVLRHRLHCMHATAVRYRY